MMKPTILLSIVCRENHNDLVDSFKMISSLPALNRYQGNEDFSESLQQLGSGALSVAKWVGGKTLNLLDKGISTVGTQLSKSFDDNKSLIGKINSNMKSEDSVSFTFSGGVVGGLTSTGQWDDFGKDLDTLIKTLEGFEAHSKQVVDYLSKELTVARELKSAKSTTAIMAVVKRFEELTYPKYNLPHTNDGWGLTDVLPAGKVIKFKQKDKTVDYSMSGDKPSGESHTLEATKDEIQHILAKISKLNEIHLKVKESYADYLDFVKAWSSVVEEASKGLSETTNVGSHIISEAEAILKGNANTLAFYSGFTPRVVSYVDKYIQDFLGVLSKVI